MARDCPSCSTQNIDGARFCRSCGTVLQPSSPTSPTSIIDPAIQSSDLHTSPVQYPAPNEYSNPNRYPYVNPAPIAPIIPTAPDYGPNFQPGYNPYFASGPRYPLAGFGSRFLAYFIDQIPFIFFVFPTYVATATLNDGRHSEPISALLLVAALTINFIYWMINIYLLGQNGATVGKRIVGIKCLGQDGQPLGFGKALLREFVKSAMGSFCIIMLLVDNLWMLGDQEKQTLHDKTVSTHVFKT